MGVGAPRRYLMHLADIEHKPETALAEELIPPAVEG